jgi:hypothetical protein
MVAVSSRLASSRLALVVAWIKIRVLRPRIRLDTPRQGSSSSSLGTTASRDGACWTLRAPSFAYPDYRHPQS